MTTRYEAIILAALLMSGGTMAQAQDGPANRSLRNALVAGGAGSLPSVGTPSGLRDAPVNDRCADVTPDALGVGATITFTGTTEEATDTDDFVPGSSLDGFDPTVWHAFTLSECATVTVSYCNTTPPFATVWLFLSPDCPAGDNVVLASSSDQSTCPNNNWTVQYVGLPAGTYHLPVRFHQDDSNGPYSIDVTASACPGGYCAAGATDTFFEKILSVTFADIDNVSNSMDGYEDFTGVVGTVARDSTYDITVFLSDGQPADEVLVWIDLDRSESFEPGELLYTSNIGDGPHAGTITIPSTASLGLARMRVRMHATDLGPNADPCGVSAFGQVEDYSLIITGDPGDCEAFAGTLSGGGETCLDNGVADLTATPDGNEVVPSGYTVMYLLSAGPGLVIMDASPSPGFQVNAADMYVIHALVHDPATLDLGIINPGVTSVPDVLALLVQGGGDICGNIDLAGAVFTVVDCGGYCIAGADGGAFDLDEWIARVVFSDIDNSDQPGPAGYQDFTAQTATVHTGESVPFIITLNAESGGAGFYPTDQVLIWIDLNQDEDFEDAGEQVFASALPLGDAVVTGSIVVPNNATLGTTRMRIRLHDTDTDLGLPNPTPCGNSSYGQVEDYSVRIDIGTGVPDGGNTPWQVFPNPGDGDLTIHYAGTDALVTMELMDVTGRLVHGEQRRLGTGQRAFLPLAGRIAAGTYVLRLTSGEERHEQRVVVR